MNGTLLPSFQGRIVTLVGKVTSQGAGTATVEACDGNQVQVSRDGEAYSSGFVEITGLVNPDNSVQEYKCCAFGDNLDMDSYNQMVQLSHGQYKHLFMA